MSHITNIKYPPSSSFPNAEPFYLFNEDRCQGFEASVESNKRLTTLTAVLLIYRNHIWNLELRRNFSGLIDFWRKIQSSQTNLHTLLNECRCNIVRTTGTFEIQYLDSYLPFSLYRQILHQTPHLNLMVLQPSYTKTFKIISKHFHEISSCNM